MEYYVPNATSQQVIRDLIHFLNHRGCDTTFLIDECDTLCPMPKAAIQKFLSQIEQEFHVKFDFTAADELTKRIAATDRGGLGISIEIISNCLMAVREQWREYFRMIETDVPRDTALHIFDQAQTCTISLPLLRKAMELMR